MNPEHLPPVSEAELHAWVDGQLAPQRVGAVSAWLLAHPDDAARVQAWQGQRLGLQGLHRGLLDEAVPPALVRATQAPRPWRQAIAAGLLLALGFAGGWGLRPAATALAGAEPAYVNEARTAHVVYLPEKRHPVEVGAAEQQHLVQWLSRRLGRPLKIPLLEPQGFGLMGGRLLPGSQGEPRALFMFESSAGERISLHVSALAEASPDTAFQFTRVGPTETFYWVDGRLAYALSGELPRERLSALADSVYRQLQ